MLSAVDFFSLQQYAHSSLWNQTTHVWEALLSLDAFFLSQCFKIEIKIPQNVFLENPHTISIGAGTIIEPGVLIQGPCIIGKGCHIRHSAFLRGSVVLGDHCVVGHGSEIKKSIFLNNAVAAHLCYVGDSILGSGVNLGAGVKCSNVRLDNRKVLIQKIDTGMRKLGAILGDGVQVGCNCVLNPGTVIGKKSLVHPLLNVGGYIPPQSVVKQERSWTAHPENILAKLLQ